MKKTMILLTALTLALLPLMGMAEVSPDEFKGETLNVYNWGEYVDMDVIREFEKEYGVKPILYTGYRFRVDILNTPEFDAYPYWIAHYYINELEYKGKWTFWQHTDCGKVQGIRGFVDCNIFNGSPEELRELTLPEPQ